MTFKIASGLVGMTCLLAILGVSLMLGASVGVQSASVAEIHTGFDEAETDMAETTADIRAGETDAARSSAAPFSQVTQPLIDRFEALNPLSKYNDRVEPYTRSLAAASADATFTVSMTTARYSAIAAYHANQVLPRRAIIYPMQAVSMGVVLAAFGIQLYRVREVIQA